jgi:hypothetical protein
MSSLPRGQFYVLMLKRRHLVPRQGNAMHLGTENIAAMQPERTEEEKSTVNVVLAGGDPSRQQCLESRSRLN